MLLTGYIYWAQGTRLSQRER